MTRDDSQRIEDVRREIPPPVGFERPLVGERPACQRIVLLHVVASLTLALSTLVTATVITIGYARAAPLETMAAGDSGLFGLALLLGLLLASFGGLTAAMARGRRSRD
jgi:hypothetical protein